MGCRCRVVDRVVLWRLGVFVGDVWRVLMRKASKSVWWMLRGAWVDLGMGEK